MLRSLVISFFILMGISISGFAQNDFPNNMCITQMDDSVGLYTINYHILNYDFTGLLLFKRMNDSCYRAVLTSEMGPKILDMYLFENDFKLNFAIDQINRLESS